MSFSTANRALSRLCRRKPNDLRATAKRVPAQGRHLAVALFCTGILPICVLFCDQKSTRKVPLLPRRGARLRGCSPLRTPKRRSRSKKAKPCRSAARFLTLFYFSPIDPSGAKTGRRRLAAIVLAAKRAASEQRDFFASFWSQKGRPLWKQPIIKGRHRMVVAPVGMLLKFI